MNIAPLANGYYNTIYVLYYSDEAGNHVNLDAVDGLPLHLQEPERDKPIFWHSEWWGAIRL